MSVQTLLSHSVSVQSSWRGPRDPEQVGYVDEAPTAEETLQVAAFIDKLAWINVVDGRVLSTRSRGKDTFYLPGGKREPGETDHGALRRELNEELTISLIEGTIRFFGEFRAQAHGHPDGVTVVMRCYRAEYTGTPQPASEIEEVAWLGYAGRNISSPVDQIIFDELHRSGELL